MEGESPWVLTSLTAFVPKVLWSRKWVPSFPMALGLLYGARHVETQSHWFCLCPSLIFMTLFKENWLKFCHSLVLGSPPPSLFFPFFWGGREGSVFLYSPGWLGTHYEEQAGPKPRLPRPPLSAETKGMPLHLAKLGLIYLWKLIHFRYIDLKKKVNL